MQETNSLTLEGKIYSCKSKLNSTTNEHKM